MTFEEISQFVAMGEPPPEYIDMTDFLCYQSLSILFERFQMGSIDQEQAAAQKQKLKTIHLTRQAMRLPQRTFDL